MRKVILLLTALGCAGCGEGLRQHIVDPARMPAMKRIALLPIENVSEQKDAGTKVTHIFMVEMFRAGIFSLPDMGEVEHAMAGAQIRAISEVDQVALLKLSDSLKVAGILMGTVLEYQMLRKGRVEIPAVAISARLLDAKTGEIVWVGNNFRKGDDKETLFGMGRESSFGRLAQETVSELVLSLKSGVGGTPK